MPGTVLGCEPAYLHRHYISNKFSKDHIAFEVLSKGGSRTTVITCNTDFTGKDIFNTLGMEFWFQITSCANFKLENNHPLSPVSSDETKSRTDSKANLENLKGT